MEEASQEVVENEVADAPEAEDSRSFAEKFDEALAQDRAAEDRDESVEAPAEAKQAEESQETKEDLDPIDALFADTGEQAQPEEPDPTPEAKRWDELKGPSQERFRTLANQASEAQQQAQQWQQYAMAMGQQMQSLQQQMQQLQTGVRPAEPEEDDPVAQLRNQIKESLNPEFQKLLEETVNPLQEKLTAYEQEKLQAQRAQQAAQAEQRILAEVEQRRANLIPGLDPEDFDAESSEAVDNLILISALALGTDDLEQVVPFAQKNARAIAKLVTKAAQKKSAQLKPKATGPTVVTTPGVTNAKTQSRPFYTKQQIQQAGYRTRWEAARDNYSKLQSEKPQHYSVR